MRYAFLVETYATERVKVVSVWSEFRDGDLLMRPRQGDPRGRSVHEQMVHQCVSEDLWFRNMLGIDVGAPPLPKQEIRLEFIKRHIGELMYDLPCHRGHYTLATAPQMTRALRRAQGDWVRPPPG